MTPIKPLTELIKELPEEQQKEIRANRKAHAVLALLAGMWLITTIWLGCTIAVG